MIVKRFQQVKEMIIFIKEGLTKLKKQILRLKEETTKKEGEEASWTKKQVETMIVKRFQQVKEQQKLTVVKEFRVMKEEVLLQKECNCPAGEPGAPGRRAPAEAPVRQGCLGTLGRLVPTERKT